jgi:tRNA threonylcarbamoyladenosine biosynthesis protein TsaB
VAQGLAFGAGVKVLPIDTLLAVAEEARYQNVPEQPHCRVLALLDARMDELYAAHYEFDGGAWTQREDYQLLHPEDVTLQGSQALAGNVFASYGERLRLPPELPRWQALPTAAAMLRLAPALWAGGHAVAPEDALPRYIRDKVAKTTLEREAEKAAR